MPPAQQSPFFALGAVAYTGTIANVSKKTKPNQYVVVVHVASSVNAELVALNTAEEARRLSAAARAPGFDKDALLQRRIDVTKAGARHIVASTSPLSDTSQVEHVIDEATREPPMDQTGDNDGVAEAGARTVAVVNAAWPSDRTFHKVILSCTGRPTKKANVRKPADEVQLTMVRRMVNSIPNVLYPVLRKGITRPPGDVMMYIEYHLAMCELGDILGHAHLQEVVVLWSAYPVMQSSAMDAAAARRAVGQTKRNREKAMRNHAESPTIKAFKEYHKLYLFDRSQANLNWQVNACELSAEARVRCYPAKDWGEPHAAMSSLILDAGNQERSLNDEDMESLHQQAHMHASSERRGYRKVLKQKHLYMTDDNALLRVQDYFERFGLTKAMPALETGIKNMLLDNLARLDMKGLPKLQNSTVTDSIRRNLALIIDADPTILIDNPNIICTIWSGDEDAVTKLQEYTNEFRSKKNLPSLNTMHCARPAELRQAVVTGDLNGESMPMRPRPYQGTAVVIDYAAKGGAASDAERVIKQEHFTVISTISSHLVNVDTSTWAAVAIAEMCMRKGTQFDKITGVEHSDVTQTAKRHVMSRFNEIWRQRGMAADDTFGANDDSPTEPLSDSLMLEYMQAIDDPSPVAMFNGIMTYSEWYSIFTDTINMSDDTPDGIHVHIAIVYTEATKHAMVVCWRISKARNDELLRVDAEDAMAVQGNGSGDEEDGDNT